MFRLGLYFNKHNINIHIFMANALGAFENCPQNCVQYVRDGDRKCASSPSANTCSSEGVLCHLPASLPLTTHPLLPSLLIRPAWLVFLYASQEMPTNIVSMLPKYTKQYFVWHYKVYLLKRVDPTVSQCILSIWVIIV